MVRFQVGAIVVMMLVGGPVRSQLPHGADQQEVAAALADLEAAGTPASAADIADFLAEASPSRVQGIILARLNRVWDQPWEHTARLGLSQDRWEVKGRWRRYRDGTTQSGGAAKLGGKRWHVAGGQLGITQGYGLLVGPPGRGPSLTADSGLGQARRGLRLWSGTPVSQSLTGAAVAGGWRGWQLRVLSGLREGGVAVGGVTSLAQLSLTQTAWQVDVLVLSDPDETGASLAGRWQFGNLDGAWETTWRHRSGAMAPLVAILLQESWRPHPRLRFELITGWSDLGARPVMGQKHPVFGDWSGLGFAWRGTWRAAPGLGFKFLLHRGNGRDEVAVGRRRTQSLSDVLLTYKIKTGWFGEGRWRQGKEQVNEWSERFPWLPPAVAWWDSRRVVSLKVGWRTEQNRVQVLWRRLDLARVRQQTGWESGGTRDLFSLNGSKRFSRLVLVRAGWTESWGDPVDLVSAVVPFRGFVLPRHWGQWQSEHYFGLELGADRWRCQLAVSWRQTDALDGADQWGAWLENGWQW